MSGADLDLQGRCASEGKATGRVRIVKDATDSTAVLEGEILVAPTTTPGMLPAMTHAGAIITDEGGMTSHAAVVAREFDIPTVVATGDATGSLSNGEIVQVVASAGKIKRES